jgi:hypothetical protein
MDKRTFISIFIMLTGSLTVPAQHFIGLDKTEVKKLMAEHRKELFIDESSVNTVFNTLKYIDRFQNQTLLFVFTEDDICAYSKWMCDYSMMNKVIAELNSEYRQSATNTWHYREKDKPYIITLTTGDWFFTITTRKEEKVKDR